MKSNTDDTNRLPQAIAHEIQEVLTDLNRFVADWSARFVQCADQVSSAKEPDEVLKEQMAEFRAEQQNWESQKHFEQQQLEASANLLTEAWIRVEAEQRARLQVATAMPEMVQIEPCSDGIDESRGTVTQPVQSKMEAVPTRSVTTSRVALPPDLIPRDAAVRQFEKLKHALSSYGPSST